MYPFQLNSLLAELNPNFSTLIKGMRSGIIVSILNACKKFHSNEGEVCEMYSLDIILEQLFSIGGVTCFLKF